jgi:FAD dependent oxidoreductase
VIAVSRSGVVLVCGAGAAGMAAALAAARAGAEVVLIEESARAGGTVADCLIHTIGGLFDDAGELLNHGLPAELADALRRADPATGKRRIGRTWVLDADPDVYRAVVTRWLAEAGVRVLCGSRVARVGETNGRIVSATVNRAGEARDIPTRAVVDATGTAEVVRLLDASLLQPGPTRMAGGLVLRLRGIAPGSLAPPRGVAVVRALRSSAAEGRLPAECGHAWLDKGLTPDEVFLKLLVAIPADWREREPELTRDALAVGERVTDLLRGLAGFSGATVFRVGRLGVREGGRVRGEYTLIGDDVRQGRRFPDAACRCAWPVELWDARSGVSLEYLPAGARYEVPLRALKVSGVANFWTAGKCLSADAEAQASARIAGCCWAMGEAAGRAAAE